MANKSLVLTVPNSHIAEGGLPPNLDASQFSFCSYFENDYGEQMVVIFSHEKGARLYHGDIGWEMPVTVVDGLTPGIILSKEEMEWLSLCWKQIELRKEIKRRKEGGEHSAV